MTSTTPQFLAPSPLVVARASETRRSGVVYSTSTPKTMGEAAPVESHLTQTVVATEEIRREARANTRIHRPRVQKRAFSRLTAPEFDPALVTRNPGR